ncbi:MAG: tetratricopeptide repeat protein [Bacteroidota bacterium]
MGKVLQFSPKPPTKFGFERVKKKKKDSPEKKGQLNLFAGGGTQVLKLPTNLSPFEEALLLDERGDGWAEQAYLQAIVAGDGVADAYCNLGIIESQAGQTPKAFDCFTRSLEHDPRHFESHYNLGNLYFDEGNLRLAKMHFELAAEIEPAFPNLYFNLGLVHAMNQNFIAAISSLRKYKELVRPEEGGKADELLVNLQRSIDLRK